MTYMVPTTLNPADKGAGVILADGNRTVATGSVGQARSITKVSSGKWYVEVTRQSDNRNMFGLANASAVLTQYPGQSTNSIGLYAGQIYYNNSAVEGVGALATTGVFGLAIDADARTVRFFNAGGTSTARAIGFTGDIYLSLGRDNTSYPGGVTLNAGQSAFTYSVPSGYTAGFALMSALGISGVVTDAAGAPAARTIYGYNRSSGALTCTAVSSASTGSYLLIQQPNNTDPHVVVALPTATTENALVFDRLVPA